MIAQGSIRLLVVDDHLPFRLGMVAMLNDEPDMRVVADARDGMEAIALYRTHCPDVVLMDLRLPGMSGVETTLALREEFPTCRIIVITTFDGDEDIYRALQSGAQSYLLKDMLAEEMIGVIRSVQAGKPQIPAAVAGRLAERMRRPELTAREHEVVHLLVRGRSNKEMATHLGVSEETVKTHLKGLFVKLGVRDRTQAAIYALQHGIVHLD
ncbi:MAG TPA: response regulator transcription factor [Chthoniobacteraceae bacterium]|jgi:two-component system NarL family response regulator